MAADNSGSRSPVPPGAPDAVADPDTVREFRLPGLDCSFTRLAGPLPIHRAQVTRAQWRAAASIVRSLGGRLVTLWGIDRRTSDGHFAVAVAYALNTGLVWLDLPLTDADTTSYPDLTATFFSAVRMQRAVADLSGLTAAGAGDARPWVRHAAWPADYYPLRREPSGRERFAALDEQYPFVTVEGDGVHEIAVGPVHAGIIEPGHFRFSVVGEKVLRLEERLGYTHKGIEKRFEAMRLAQGTRLAARVSGDSTVAYGWAYCAAAEALCDGAVPERAQWLRALALERERIANHLGDLGALGNDAALSFGLAQFSRLREAWLRRNHELVGHRLMMDWIVPGGVASDLLASALETMREDCDAVEAQVRNLESIYDAHAGLQDRFVGTGRIDAELARRLNLTGMAARASGLQRDLRSDFGGVPYEAMQVRSARAADGDVAARVAVRFAEVYESLRLVRNLAHALPAGATLAALDEPRARGCGAGWIEAWRGEVLVTIELDDRGLILRAHCHDPSWQNWPALEHAVIGNIVPDFPLINKSFNLSYSGQDL
ncbi:membrane-bound (NiFe)-hydrogenase (Ehf-type, Group 4f), large subunit E [Burkholderiales bacterium]|nr:membrane-bound (NiFe)-hydrogenase (Ehf-type, Group 4f), large subunit E [Burkholderiales bacterium]